VALEADDGERGEGAATAGLREAELPFVNRVGADDEGNDGVTFDIEE
jgi:hypothetical protein